jgi:tetratricopeptide (TPR) repeat protein
MCILAVLIMHAAEMTTAPRGVRISGRVSAHIMFCCLCVFIIVTAYAACLDARFSKASSEYSSTAIALHNRDYAHALQHANAAVDLDQHNALYLAASGLAFSTFIDTGNMIWTNHNIALHLTPEDRFMLDAAIWRYRAAIKENSLDALAWHNLAWLVLLQGNIDEALDDMRTAVMLEPTDWTYRVSYGIVLERTGDIDNASKEYIALLRINPHILNSDFFRDLKDRHPELTNQLINDALNSLEESFTKTHSPIIAAKAGSILTYKHDYKRAEILLSHATKQMPSLYRAWLNLGEVMGELRDQDGATRCFRKAHYISPSDPDVAERWSAMNGLTARAQNTNDATTINVSNPEDYGIADDRNLRLFREYSQMVLIRNNVFPRELLEYCGER